MDAQFGHEYSGGKAMSPSRTDEVVMTRDQAQQGVVEHLARVTAERQILRQFVVRQIEEYFGCPHEDIQPHERTTWALRHTESKAELDVMIAALTQHVGQGATAASQPDRFRAEPDV